MIENIYHRQVQLPPNVVFAPAHRMDLEPPEKYKVISSDVLNGVFYLWLMSLGVRCTKIRFFSNLPSTKYSIHVDTEAGRTNNCTFMNFQYGGEGSSMIWYEPRSLPTPIKNMFGAYINTWQPNEVVEVHRASLGFPSLVNAGVPHTMVNGAHHRYCYSLDISRISDGKGVDWEMAMEIFGKHLLPE